MNALERFFNWLTAGWGLPENMSENEREAYRRWADPDMSESDKEAYRRWVEELGRFGENRYREQL